MKIQNGLENGQVLQRRGRAGASLSLSGSCRTTGPVEVAVFGQAKRIVGWKATGNASDEKFAATLKGIPAGGPYRLELRVGNETCKMGAFYVGDVWLLAGQSNMEGLGNMDQSAPPHPLVRAFSLARQWSEATDPLHVLRESPDFCHHRGQPFTPAEARRYRRTAATGVGLGIFFAREMLRRTGVPQGLICAARGGTSLTQWLPASVEPPDRSLYESMLHSIRATGQPLAGVLWYQGESDASTGDVAPYTDRMKHLVASVRRDLGQRSLPWLMVQIGRVFDSSIQAGFWNEIQEQQRSLPKHIEHLEIVSAIDLPLDDRIHISSVGHARLGARLACMAERLVLANKPRLKSPPDFRRAVVVHPPKSRPRDSTTIDVVFEHVATGLRAGSEPSGFSLVTKDGSVWPYCYKTTLRDRTARLHLTRNPPDDIRVQYGQGLAPVCNITDARDLSLPAFGPRPLTLLHAYLPFVTSWRVTGVIANPPLPLAELRRPDRSAFESVIRTYGLDGFINERPNWQGRNGQAYFFAQIDLPEPMRLQFLLGYAMAPSGSG